MLKYEVFKNTTKSRFKKVLNFITEKVQTVMDTDIKEEVFSAKNSLFDTELKVKVHGLGVERSYEDRDVYLEISYRDLQPKNENTLRHKEADLTTWLRGEDAISLGQMLIKHGLFSLESNMVNHQKIHHYNQLKDFLKEDRIEKIVMTNLSDVIEGYGSGFHKFSIKPIWKKDKEPQYQEDFEFEDVIYFSPFENEYKQQIKKYGGENKIEFINYDYKKEVDEFNKAVQKLESLSESSLVKNDIVYTYLKNRDRL